jgi:hypothetical protein
MVFLRKSLRMEIALLSLMAVEIVLRAADIVIRLVTRR